MSQSYLIERLSIQADGVTHGPDGTVYAALTLPGEEITGELSAGRIAQPKVISPSGSRVRPPCPHYRSCGGCALQHASDEFVAQWKTEVIETALAKQGIDTKVSRVETSPARSRKRATLSGRRTKKGTQIGFHARASDTITEVPDCQLLRPELIAVIPALREATLEGGSRKGEISFALTLSLAGVEVAATGGKDTDPALFSTLSAIAHTYDLARLSWNGETIAARRPAWQEMGRAHVTPPAGAFLQATTEGAQALVNFTKGHTEGAKQVLDLFAGCGTFSLPLAEKAEVHAVEAEGAMLAALDQGWRQATGLKRVTTETRDLFRRPLLPDELARFDAVVLDPPRAGAEAQIREIADSTSQVQNLTYISCNPLSFARDAAILTASGFNMDALIAVDQFRWSAHVELASHFTRA